MEIKIPRVNANDDEIEIAHWHVEDGGRVEKGMDLVDIASSKAVFTVQAEESGYVKHCFKVGERGMVGSTLLILSPEATRSKVENTVAEAKSDEAKGITGGGNFGFTKFSASADAYIKQNKIDRTRFEGMGLVTLETVKSVVGSAAPPLTTIRSALRAERVLYFKKREIETLSYSWANALISSLTVEMSSEKLHKTLRDRKALSGQLLPIILFEFSGLLKENPLFTAYYDDGKVFFYDRVDVGLAIDFGKGLRVAVIKEADKCLPIDFLARTTEFALKYERGELSGEDLTGGTVTVTDLSGMGIRHFQPMLNERQSVILGIGGDKSLPGQPLSLTLVFDHRVLTGREVGGFLASLKERILKYETASSFPTTS